MSSVNPVFVLPGAMRERSEQIASGLHSSMTLGAGQFCTKPGMVIVGDGSDSIELTRKLGELVSSSQQFTLLNRGIWSAFEAAADERSGSTRTHILGEAKVIEGLGFQVAAVAFEADANDVLRDPSLSDELFGPSTLVVKYSDREQLLALARNLEGHLTATIHGNASDLVEYKDLIDILERKVGRLIFNGFPTGVEVSHAMVHGGPYPATSDARSTSVGTMAIFRFARPVCFQGFPNEVLPAELQGHNPLGIWRMVDGEQTRDPI
jgi:NADP-dependent aldehyde dehydrogenase